VTCVVLLHLHTKGEFTSYRYEAVEGTETLCECVTLRDNSCSHVGHSSVDVQYCVSGLASGQLRHSCRHSLVFCDLKCTTCWFTVIQMTQMTGNTNPLCHMLSMSNNAQNRMQH